MEMDRVVHQLNIAPELEDDLKNEIGSYLCARVDEDEASREPWKKRNEEYLKMALQVAESKSFPWPRAANVKFPLLTIASLQFQARAMPAILGDGKALVKGKVVGYDPGGLKAEKAERIGKHMSFQLLEEITNWEDDMDKLLLSLPICGTIFKKIYYDGFTKKTSIDLVYPDNLIVNYWAKDLKTARRITEKFYLYHNEVISRQRDGTYDDVDISTPPSMGEGSAADLRESKVFTSGDSKDIPHEMLEVHTYWDIDEDGYEEPWIFTIERNTRKLVRAVANFDLKSIRKNPKGEIVEITPKEYYVKYGFIPSPDGGFYNVGFGILLGPLNETASTAINQLLDAGTMATTGGGLLGKGIKLKGGQVAFAPNEWKQVQFTGDDLRKHIFPLPVREPSPVLLNLLQMIVAAGKEIISISEISTGKLPGQNTPATTTMSSIEEGLKLFNSIYKRIWRAQKKELSLLFSVNKDYLDDEVYFNILDAKEGQNSMGKVNRREDYNTASLDVIPTADPTTVSDSVRLIKAQQIIELIPLGGIDPAQATQRVLKAMDQPNPQELMPQPQGPDPKVEAMQMKSQMDQQKAQQDMQIREKEAMIELQMKQMEMRMKALEAQLKLQTKTEELRLKERDSGIAETALLRKHAIEEVAGYDKIQMKREEHKQKLKERADGAGKGTNK
jgi:chaperonin GroES